MNEILLIQHQHLRIVAVTSVMNEMMRPKLFESMESYPTDTCTLLSERRYIRTDLLSIEREHGDVDQTQTDQI